MAIACSAGLNRLFAEWNRFSFQGLLPALFLFQRRPGFPARSKWVVCAANQTCKKYVLGTMAIVWSLSHRIHDAGKSGGAGMPGSPSLLNARILPFRIGLEFELHTIGRRTFP